MKLRLKPFPKNIYPKKGLLIKGSSPLVWFYEMEILGIDLSSVTSFAIPSNEPNILYGCLLIFQNSAPDEIGKNSYFQCVDNTLFIPENTIFYPKINSEDWQNIDCEYLVMHPEFGLVKLSEQIDWVSLLHEPSVQDFSVKKPLNGVKIPQSIETYTVEIDDEKVLETLQQPQTEEEWMKNLPFDLKKVMAGNKKEIEKYLKYIEKYPDRAIDLGVPLDIMGTSRGDGFGKFIFGDNWFGRLFGRENNAANASEKNYRWIFWVSLIAIALFRFFMHISKEEPGKMAPVLSSGKVFKGGQNQIHPVVAYQSGITEIDMKIDSVYGKKRRRIINEYAKASAIYISRDENRIKKYKQLGNRDLDEIYKDLYTLNTHVQRSKDSLKTVYSNKIAKHIEKKSENWRQKISDSLKSSGKPAAEGIVKNIWNKKKILMADSLGRLYGTLDLPEPIADNNSKIKTTDHPEQLDNNPVSISEIVWLIIFMTGVVGFYSFVLKRKSINIGGGNVPVGIKVFLVIVLIAMLLYLFYPLIQAFGYNWFVWILIFCVILLLYRLFSEDKTILKTDKDE